MKGARVTPSKIEAVGIALAITGVMALAVATGALAGWPAATLVAGAFALAAGVLLIRLAALTPTTTTETGGDDA